MIGSWELLITLLFLDQCVPASNLPPHRYDLLPILLIGGLGVSETRGMVFHLKRLGCLVVSRACRDRDLGTVRCCLICIANPSHGS